MERMKIKDRIHQGTSLPEIRKCMGWYSNSYLSRVTIGLLSAGLAVHTAFFVQDTEEGYMQIYDNDLRYKQIQNKMMNMPQWAKAEHMEMSVPEKEFWQYSGDAMCPSQKQRRCRGVLLTLTMHQAGSSEL